MLKKQSNYKNYPKISIVIASFNKVDYIEATLNSIFNQNYPNLEVIIQDGGSRDGTIDIINKYLRKYPMILNFESKKDNGQTDALNKGFKKTTGDLLGFINADDVYKTGAFKTLAEVYLKNTQALWFAGRGEVINSNGQEIAKPVTLFKNLCLSINNRTLLLINNYLMQPSVFMARKGCKIAGDFVGIGKAVLEYSTWLKLSKLQMPVVINSTLSSFRLLSDAFSSSQFRSILKADEEIVKKETNNSIIVFLHKLFNFGRVLLVS